MANLQLYSSAYVFVAGALLTQESSVTVDKNPGLNLVYTTVVGLAGASQGASVAEITVDNAVPSADFELNPDQFMATGAVVEVKVQMASRTSVFTGFIMGATYSHSVNDSSKLTMKFTCRFAPFE